MWRRCLSTSGRGGSDVPAARSAKQDEEEEGESEEALAEATRNLDVSLDRSSDKVRPKDPSCYNTTTFLS